MMSYVLPPPSGYHEVSAGPENSARKCFSGVEEQSKPNRSGVFVSDHLSEEPKLDVDTLREAIQEEYAEVAAKIGSVEWITEYTYRS